MHQQLAPAHWHQLRDRALSSRDFGDHAPRVVGQPGPGSHERRLRVDGVGDERVGRSPRPGLDVARPAVEPVRVLHRRFAARG